MKAEVKELWTTALRSGEYEQTKGRLAVLKTGDADNVPEGYCCLGVLCELAFKAGVPMKVTNLASDDGDFVFRSYDDSSGTLPFSVMDWAGVAYSNPVLNGNNASYWNDSPAEGLTFPQIADLIEEHL